MSKEKLNFLIKKNYEIEKLAYESENQLFKIGRMLDSIQTIIEDMEEESLDE